MKHVLFILFAVCPIALLAPVSSLAQPPVVVSELPATLSQIDFNASLSIDEIREKLQTSLTEALKEAPLATVNEERNGWRVTVTPRVRASKLNVRSNPTGRLEVSVPIDISVKPKKTETFSFGALAEVEGCKRTTYDISAGFLPEISSAGALRFTLDDVLVKNNAYKCAIKPLDVIDIVAKRFNIEKSVDIAEKIHKRLVKFGRTAFGKRLAELNQLLPKADALLKSFDKPAEFGGAVTLGLDVPRLRMTRVSSNDDDYTISGVVEGQPRLLFGDNWMIRESDTEQRDASAGFRLPARLLFPTDKALLPDASTFRASGCLGAFRLHPVPARKDLSVLQRCDQETNINVIWLSGASNVPTDSDDPLLFDQGMTNVLKDIVGWLDAPDLWSGVDDVPLLREKVSEFLDLLNVFEQQETTIPIDTRGRVRFSELHIDLIRIWVTNEAIHADVMLTGNARLDIKLSL